MGENEIEGYIYLHPFRKNNKKWQYDYEKCNKKKW